MIPLQLTETAPNASPTPGKTGKAQREGDGAFAAMFDRTRPSNNDAAAPKEGSKAADLTTADVEKEDAEETVSTVVESDEAPFVTTSAPSVTAATSEDVEIIGLTTPKEPAVRTQAEKDGEAPPARSTAKGSLAQSMVEGRFPPAAPAPQPSTDESVGTMASSSPLPEAASKDKTAVMASAPVLSGRAAASASGVSDPGRAAPAISEPVTTTATATAMPATQGALSQALAQVSKPGSAVASAQQEEARSSHAVRGELPISATPTPSPAAANQTVEIKAVPPAVATAAAAAKSDLNELGKVQLTGADPLDEMVPGMGTSERAGAATPQATVTAAPATAGIETARHVAGQISVAVSGPGGRATEISLSPEELGRVRLHMTAVDQTITLHVIADRPETTDLLRRHIDVLAQEFRALGYEDIAFSFGDGTSANSADTEGDDSHDRPQQAVSMKEPDINVIQATGPQTGLDLRL